MARLLALGSLFVVLGISSQVKASDRLLDQSFDLFFEKMKMQWAYDSLRNEAVDYTSEGSICEELARLEFSQFLSDDRFELQVGIVYKTSNIVRGELDLVVFDKIADKAVIIAEVKCSGSPGRAIQKARDQLKRFQDYIRSGKEMEMYLLKEPSRRFEQSSFSTDAAFATISVDGSRAFGFDFQLPLDITAARQLRTALQNCQRAGQCPTPPPLLVEDE